MKNHALLKSKYDLNRFTKELKKQIYIQDKIMVRLRNDNYVFVFHKTNAEDEDIFFSKNWEYCWNADGSSITSKDYDIIEFVV